MTFYALFSVFMALVFIPPIFLIARRKRKLLSPDVCIPLVFGYLLLSELWQMVFAREELTYCLTNRINETLVFLICIVVAFHFGAWLERSRWRRVDSVQVRYDVMDGVRNERLVWILVFSACLLLSIAMFVLVAFITNYSVSEFDKSAFLDSATWIRRMYVWGFSLFTLMSLMLIFATISIPSSQRKGKLKAVLALLALSLSWSIATGQRDVLMLLGVCLVIFNKSLPKAMVYPAILLVFGGFFFVQHARQGRNFSEMQELVSPPKLSAIFVVTQWSMELVPDSQPFFCGKTYLYSLGTFVPGELGDYYATLTPVVWFRDIFPYTNSVGLDYSCVAEAYINFGFAGACIMTIMAGTVITKGYDICNRPCSSMLKVTMSNSAVLILLYSLRTHSQSTGKMLAALIAISALLAFISKTMRPSVPT